MAEETQKVSVGEGLQDKITQVEAFVENNKNAVLVGGGIVVAIIIALVYVFAKYLPDENLKAQKASYMAEFAFAKDSFALALNGNATFKGFADVADKYNWTKAGNLANYYAGICCLNLKKYDDAVKYLNKFSTKDPVLGALKLSATGDALAESGKMEESIGYYEKAAGFSDNDGYTPYFLLKAGLAYEHQKKNAEAKKLYEKVRDKYPNSDEGRDIEKYIARVSAATN
jgi:tetratricopeptide (TPR) repeat protein